MAINLQLNYSKGFTFKKHFITIINILIQIYLMLFFSPYCYSYKYALENNVLRVAHRQEATTLRIDDAGVVPQIGHHLAKNETYLDALLATFTILTGSHYFEPTLDELPKDELPKVNPSLISEGNAIEGEKSRLSIGRIGVLDYLFLGLPLLARLLHNRSLYLVFRNMEYNDNSWPIITIYAISSIVLYAAVLILLWLPTNILRLGTAFALTIALSPIICLVHALKCLYYGNNKIDVADSRTVNESDQPQPPDCSGFVPIPAIDNWWQPSP